MDNYFLQKKSQENSYIIFKSKIAGKVSRIPAEFSATSYFVGNNV